MPVIVFAIALILTVVSPSVEATEVQCDGNEEMLQTYLEMTDVLFNQRDGDRVGEFYAEEIISHNSDAGGSEPRVVTHDFFKRMWRHSLESTPDRLLVNDLILCAGDMLTARITATGTRTGENLVGNPPEGRRFRVTGIDIYRFKDGKVVERWGNTDSLSMIRQTGMEVDLSLRPLD